MNKFEIAPALNCPDYSCVETKLKIIRGFLPASGWVHLDVADAKFTHHKTWNDPGSWANLRCNYNLEVHLMVEDVEDMVAAWVGAGAKRVIVHYEALIDQRYKAIQKKLEDRIKDVLAICWESKAEAFLAVNPETPVATLTPHFEKFSGAQVLAVHPGLSGQKFQPMSLDKIAFLRRALPDATIEVDGGVTPEIAARAKAAGADIAVSSSYLFDAADPKKAYEGLLGA